MKRILISMLCAAGVLSSVSCSRGDAGDGLDPIRRGLDAADFQLRMNAEAFAGGDLFPRSWKDGKFKTADIYDWTSGFFPGSLWLGYRLTGDEKLKNAALAYTARLHDVQYYKGTHDLGFMMFCSYGRQYEALGDDESAAAIVESARSLISRADERIGLIRSWDFGEWNYPVIIDNMMNLEMLFWASRHTGDPVYRDVAVRHADITMQNHFREDCSSYHVVSYNDDGTVESKGTFQGYSDSSSWARGQAWGLYGYTMCFRETGDRRYLDHAEKIAALVMNHPNTPEDRIPYWDYNAPDIPDAPRDASAAAVMSSALFELSTFAEGELAQSYFDYAERLLLALCSDDYLAAKGENGGFIIKHCVGHLPANSEIDTPLNYADYYYLEAIARYLDLKGVDARTLSARTETK